MVFVQIISNKEEYTNVKVETMQDINGCRSGVEKKEPNNQPLGEPAAFSNSLKMQLKEVWYFTTVMGRLLHNIIYVLMNGGFEILEEALKSEHRYAGI